jgi:hypothetical protein
MEVAVVALLLAKGYMQVNTSHRYALVNFEKTTWSDSYGIT